MKISVLVVSYNCCDVLLRCLASLRDSGRDDLDIVVVDNASTDGTVAQVALHFPTVTLVAEPENRGFSVAVNTAARRAKGDVFLLLNPDTEMPPGGVDVLPAALTARPDAWAVGFRQVDQEGRFQLAVGPEPTLLRELMRTFVQRRLDRHDPITAWVVDRWLGRAQTVPWVAGSSLLVWRHAFDRVGGFDERFFLYFEDIDFCLRLNNAGGKVYYDPSLTILHHRGVSAGRSKTLAQRAYRESQLMFWQKHRGPWLHHVVEQYLRLRGVAPS